ncbi:MAG: FAD-binding oxidoreductase [Jiangellaceae bacterium]
MDDGRAQLPARTVEQLRRHFRGGLISPGSEGYDESRRVWNGAVDRRPTLIARCAGADDVATAVRFARDRDLAISVRGSGHSILGHGVLDGGLVIDLSGLKDVAVDRDGRRARAGSGVTWGEFDLATQQHGLATTGATVSHVGLAGMTLLGGFGHLLRRHGLTVDTLRAVDLVTADGDRSEVDHEHEPELLWGLRGGGGNFGIATSLTYDLRPVPPLVLAGPVYWTLEQAPEVLRVTDEIARDAPDDLGIMIMVHRAPPLPFLPPQRYGTPALGLLLTWFGDVDTGLGTLGRLRGTGEPLGDAVRPVPYRSVQTMLDVAAAPGNAVHQRSVILPHLSDTVTDEITAVVKELPTASSMLTGWAIGGAASRVDPGETAIGPRPPGFELRLVAQYRPDDPRAHEHVAWVRAGHDRLRPHGDGRQYPTFLSDEGHAGVVAAYGDRLSRLVALKDRYDPDNVFRLNANIPPRGASAGTSGSGRSSGRA